MGETSSKPQPQTGSILIRCNDCGRSRVRFPHQFMRLIPPGTPSPMTALGDRLFCPNCRSQGGDGRNLMIVEIPQATRPEIVPYRRR